MEQRITDSINSINCYKINKQFLFSLVDQLESQGSSIVFLIDIWTKKTRYSFTNVSDLINSVSTIIKPINRMNINIQYFGQEKEYHTNEITLNFSNTFDWLLFRSATIEFDFYSENDYLILKNRIETLLKNYTLSYMLLSRIPLVAVCAICFLVAICTCTFAKPVVYPKTTQNLIGFICFGLIIVSQLYFSRKIKRFIFPLNEFEFGANINRNKKASTIRQFIGTGIILAFVVGISVNFISSFLF